VVFVSHDIDEAMKMADKVAIFRNGKLEQFAGPDELLARPATPFIADFVGADRALKRLRLLRAGAALVALEAVVRPGDSKGAARAALALHPHGEAVFIDINGKPAGYFTASRLDAVPERLEASMALSLPATVRADDDLRSVMSMMLAHGVSWFAVVDEAGRFAGYVTHAGIAEMARASCAGGAAFAGAVDVAVAPERGLDPVPLVNSRAEEGV
jgi:osmoprotectant transport system ATP-binding protein